MLPMFLPRCLFVMQKQSICTEESVQKQSIWPKESGQTDRQTDRQLCKDVQNLWVHSPFLENLGDGRLHCL
jgi:hypothetical protein